MNFSIFNDLPDYANTKFPEPRAFQLAAYEELRQGVREGHKNQMLMAPTGAGKTYLGLKLVYEALLKGKKAVFVCDRTTLIEQTSRTADAYGLRAHGIIQANHCRRDKSLPFQIASAQTLAKRGYWPDADLIIIDEAHTKLKVWTEHIPYNNAKCIGLSATPFSPGLGNLFTNLVNATTMSELTKSGVLVPMRVLSCTRPDMRGASLANGEWTDLAVAERGMSIVGDVVSEWCVHAGQRKTIVFGATIAHCLELCREFGNCGVMAAAFTSETSQRERQVLLEEFRKPNTQLRVLISVEALAKGFDVPDVECIVDCRPLRKSLSTAIQMWGRGLRSSPATGKKECLLLDHSGNIVRFKDDFTDLFFDGLKRLDLGEKLDAQPRKEPEEKEAQTCPECGHTPFGRRCMSCGFEFQKPALIAVAAGGMQEIFLGKKKLAEDRLHLWEQVVSYACATSSPSNRSGRAWHLYQQITGHPPPIEYRVEGTRTVQVTDNVKNKIKSLNIAYGRGRKAKFKAAAQA